MKRNLIVSAKGIALAMSLGVVAAPAAAQDYSDTPDTPVRTSPSYESQPPSETPAPRGSEEPGMEMEPHGARGPIRSDESLPSSREESRMGRRGGDRSLPASERGYMGFLEWQKTNTESP